VNKEYQQSRTRRNFEECFLKHKLNRMYAIFYHFFQIQINSEILHSYIQKQITKQHIKSCEIDTTNFPQQHRNDTSTARTMCQRQTTKYSCGHNADPPHLNRVSFCSIAHRTGQRCMHLELVEILIPEICGECQWFREHDGFRDEGYCE
jgi:hypothetical protein